MQQLFPSISILLPSLKNGDPAAWNELCELFAPGLICKSRFLLATTGLQKKYSAEDIVQEAMLKAWKQHATFCGTSTGQFARWMLTILNNALCDICRRHSAEYSYPTWFELRDESDSPSAVLISLETEAFLHACLAKLDPKYQTVLAMRHIEGLTLVAIAARLSLNVNTVAGHYRRGLVALSQLVQASDQNNEFEIIT